MTNGNAREPLQQPKPQAIGVLVFRALSLLVAGSLTLVTSGAAQAVRERVSVNDVSVRLTCIDRAGHPVLDLRPSELSLLVDGAPVAVDSLSPPLPLPQGPVLVPQVSAAPQEPANPALPRQGPASDAVYIAIFIDENDTVAFDRRDVIDELIRFLNGQRDYVARFMVARFDGVNTQLICPWTVDRAAVVNALSIIRNRPNRPLFGSENGRGAAPPPLWLKMYRAKFRRALLEMLAGFPEIAADRQLVLGTGGLALLGPLDVAEKLYGQEIRDSRADAPGGPHASSKLRQARTEQMPGEQQHDAFALWSRAVSSDTDALSTEDVLSKALERRVRLIPIAMEAIDRGTNPGVDGKNPQRSIAGDGNIGSRIGVAQALTEVADRSGGSPVLVPRNAAALLTEIEGRPAYTLSFRDPSGDHAYHSIEIKCRRPGVSLSYRRGYRFATDDERDLDRAVSSLLHVGNDDRPFPLQVELSLVRGSSGRTVTRVTVRFTPPRESVPSAEREILVLGMGEDAKGNRTQPIRWKGLARRSDTDRSAYEATFDLGTASSYRWSLSVRDLSLGVTAFVPAGV